MTVLSLLLSLYVEKGNFFVNCIILSTVNQSVSLSWRKKMIDIQNYHGKACTLPFIYLFLLVNLKMVSISS